jgi:pimeloyl-ACP methyl ester carboxylesterase
MPESRSINNEGVKVHYLDWGGDNPAAVLLHPSSFCADIWGPAAQVMSPHLRCISMDLRGHGGSGPPPGPFSWDDLAGDLVALLDALDLRECLVVGHSRGGGVSLLATARRLERVKSLMVIEPNLIDPMNPGASSRRTQLAERARRRRNIWPDRESVFNSYKTRPILAPWRDDALWAYLVGGFKDREDGQVELACSPDVEALYYLLDTPEDVWSRMAALNLPVTLIAARESDRFRMEAPATQKFIATTPNLTVKTVPGGHFLVQEDPDRIAKLVLDYAVETGVIGPYSL